MSIRLSFVAAILAATNLTAAAQAETVRIAIGTTDAVITTAAGGPIIRELKLLEKYLPRDGKYKDTTYDIEWKNFTSGAPITNEQVAGKLDFGIMAEFPGVLNRVAHEKGGRESFFIAALSGSVKGSGNGVVVPSASPVQSFAELKGKTISVPFGSAAHGLLLRIVEKQGWDPEKDVKIITQAPEVGGAALKAGQIEAHANFVPYPELFPYRGFARKIYDGSQANSPTFHGVITNSDFAGKHPELVQAYLRAVIEADRLIDEQPEKYSELIAKISGVDAEVVYLFFGPLGLQSRHLVWKPEYEDAVKTAYSTLKLLKRVDQETDVKKLLNDTFIRQAFKASGIDYDDRVKNYDRLQLVAKDALTGKAITDFDHVAQIWVKDEPLVRHYASVENAFKALNTLKKENKDVRIVYAQDRDSGLKLLADQAWFVRTKTGHISAFLLKQQAEAHAKETGGNILDYSGARASVVASN